MDYPQIVEQFCSTVGSWDKDHALQCLDRANWVLDNAVNSFFENRRGNKAAKVVKNVCEAKNLAIGLTKAFVSEFDRSEERFVSYVEKMRLLNTPNFAELDLKKVKKAAGKGKKSVLVYLHKKPSADHYLRTVIASEYFVNGLSQNFKLFGGFSKGSEGKKARSLYASGQKFTFALISEHGLSGLLDTRPALPELSEFLLSLSGIKNDPIRPPGYPRDNEVNNMPRSNEDDDLQLAIELSKFPNKEENDEEYLIAIELSKNDWPQVGRFGSQNLLQPSEQEELELLAALEESKNFHVVEEPPNRVEHRNRHEEFDNAMGRYAEELKRHDELVEKEVKQYSENLSIKVNEPGNEENKGSGLDAGKAENKVAGVQLNAVEGLGDEPGLLPSTCLITFKLPNQQRIERRFYWKDPVEKLYMFVESKGFKNFEISQGFPMTVLNSGTLESNNITSSTLCHVRSLV